MIASGGMAIYATALSIGMLHGIEPGHGWPVAAIFALNHRRRWWYGIWAAVILAAAHLVSSFAVVALYALVDRLFEIEGQSWLGIVAGALLLVMAVHQWRAGSAHGSPHRHRRGLEHGHDHDNGHDHQSHDGASDENARATSGHLRKISNPAKRGLLGLAGFAFVLGFVHEEEFAIIALSAGKVSAWAVMAAYALAVAASLVLLTSLAIATLNRFERRLLALQEKLPRISAVMLGVMGIAYIVGLI